MTYGYYDTDKHCRWCGKHYEATKPYGRDGFCKPSCKQAHYRARKKYVTLQARVRRQPGKRAVTRKKRKKRSQK